MIIVAHRGASGHKPENSYEAFELAWDMDADAVETDLRKCGYCGRIALSHDPIDSLEKHKQHFILRDFLSADFAEWMDLHLEIKDKGITSEFLVLTEQTRFKDHIIFSSFKWLELLKLRLKGRRFRIGFLWDQERVKLPRWIAALYGKILSAESVHLQFKGLDKDTVHYFRKRNFLVYAYTVNSVDEIVMARNLDLNGIFTDYPDRASNIFLNTVLQ